MARSAAPNIQQIPTLPEGVMWGELMLLLRELESVNELFSLTKIRCALLATKMIKNNGGLFKTISDNFIDN